MKDVKAELFCSHEFSLSSGFTPWLDFIMSILEPNIINVDIFFPIDVYGKSHLEVNICGSFIVRYKYMFTFQ